MASPLITVIMPAYNAAKFIGAAIQSVQAQTYAHWELIVINDGSRDDTPAIVQQAAASDSRIRFFAQENGKQAKARNTGIKNAAGQWIAFLDADDFWLPHKLEFQLSATVHHKADVYFADALMVNEHNEELGLMQAGKGILGGDDGLALFLEKNQVPVLTVMVKQELISSHLFDETPALQNAEDYELWLRLLLAGKIFYGITEPLARYRLHAAASTAADRSVFFAGITALYRLAQKFPAYRNPLLKAMGAKIIAWPGQHAGQKSRTRQLAKMYFGAHGIALSGFKEWMMNDGRLMRKMEKHFEENYA